MYHCILLIYDLVEFRNAHFSFYFILYVKSKLSRSGTILKNGCTNLLQSTSKLRSKFLSVLAGKWDKVKTCKWINSQFSACGGTCTAGQVTIGPDNANTGAHAFDNGSPAQGVNGDGCSTLTYMCTGTSANIEVRKLSYSEVWN